MSDTPFGNFGFIGDLMKLLGQQGPGSWLETARALATSIARGDDADPNPLPAERQRLEQYEPLVARHVEMMLGVTQLSRIDALTRTGLADAALREWSPLFDPQSTAPTTDLASDDPSMAMLNQLSGVMGPLMLGFQLGSVVGHFTETAWSLGALPLPREGDQLGIVVNNVATFAAEWSLEPDHATIYAIAHEHVAATFLRHDGTKTALRALLFDAIHDAQSAQGDIMQRLMGLMQGGDMTALMSNPESLFDDIALGEETSATRAMDAAAAALRAATDWLALDITHRILGATPLLDEALRRHRRNDAKGEDMAAALFGIALRGDRFEQAELFIRELVEQHGTDVFVRFFQLDGLPNADELTDPSSWYARVSNSPFA